MATSLFPDSTTTTTTPSTDTTTSGLALLQGEELMVLVRAASRAHSPRAALAALLRTWDEAQQPNRAPDPQQPALATSTLDTLGEDDSQLDVEFDLSSLLPSSAPPSPPSIAHTVSEADPPTTRFRLCAQVLPLGAFFVFVDPGCRVARLIELVETQAAELYRVRVRVVKLRDRFDVDLPPSYTIGSMLQHDDTVIADHELPPEHRRQMPPSSSTPTLASSPLPTPPAQAIPRAAGLRFTEQPPAQVFQNREFTCTLAHEPTITRRAAGEGTDGLIEVRVVDQASGSALNRTDYGVRKAALDHHEGVVVLFVKIRQNSFYGRRPFVISVVPRQGGAAVTSDPIVVVAKKKKKTMKTKKKQTTSTIV